MKRYIDADKLEADLYQQQKTLDYCHKKQAKGIEIARAILDRQPTADVQEVKHGKWISVKDRLPEKEQNCIIWTGSAYMSAFYLGNDEWFLDYYDRTQTVTSDWFTHWMEMPKPPKEG